MKKLTAILLLISICVLGFVSCGEEYGTGACEYAETRSVEGRNVSYVEMCVKNYGKVVILVDATAAPITAANFLKLVSEGFYDGLTFHRVLENFVVQGGDPNADGTGGSSSTIKGEFLLNGYTGNLTPEGYLDIKHIEGVISMARNAYDYDSASSQFFICNADATDSLDYQYASFGYVVEGLSVIEEITHHTAGYGDSNGTIANKKDQAVIKYMKILENYGK